MFAAALRFAVAIALTLFVGASLGHSRPTTFKPTTGIRIAGVEYVDAVNFGAKFGLKLQQTASNKFRLAGAGPSIVLEVDSRECGIGGNRVFLGEPVRNYRGRISVSRIDAEQLFTPIIRPGYAQSTRSAVKVIALDPGHGGKDPGNGNARLKLKEKTLALDTALRVAELLKRQGFKVVMTRSGDNFVDLDDRPEIARRSGADLFISLHYNAATVANARGIEVFTLTPQRQYSTADTTRDDDAAAQLANPGNRHDHWNALLGYSLHHALVADLKAPDRGLKRARWAVLRPASCPAVLVETGYLSNDGEARMIATAAYRQQIASAIARGVSSYAAALNAARARG